MIKIKTNKAHITSLPSALRVMLVVTSFALSHNVNAQEVKSEDQPAQSAHHATSPAKKPSTKLNTKEANKKIKKHDVDKSKATRSSATHNKEQMQHMQSKEHMQRMQKMHPMQKKDAPFADGEIKIGRYFLNQHLVAAKAYFSRPENMGYCPPGLAQKGTGCLPPGQTKLWKLGEILPRSAIYFDVPRSVVVTLGDPPDGYKYVRVASDILLIAIGTSMVVDALEDLVR